MLGSDHWSSHAKSHGGIPVSEFLSEAMQLLGADTLDAMVGMAKGMRAKGEGLFDMINALKLN